jgi:hypothetical protein
MTKYSELAKEMNLFEEMKDACSFVSRGKDAIEGKYGPGLARSQLTSSDPVLTIKVCLFQPGSLCFPMNPSEVT